MDLNFEDFKNLLLKISENENKLNLLLKGWNDFKSEIKEEIRQSLEEKKIKGYLTFNKENTPEMKYKNITIRKRTDKYLWYCRIRINKKQIYISSKNQQECLKKLKIAINNKNNIEKEDNNKDYTLIEWFNVWLELYKIKGSRAIRETTIIDYKKSTKYFGRFANVKLNKFNNIMILQLLNDIQYQRTKQKIYETLKQMFNKAKINQLIKIDPMQELEKPTYKHEEKPILSTSQEKIFIEECQNNKYGDFYLICLYQGLRRGECLALTRNDLDFENKLINIDKSINAGTKNIDTKNDYSKRKITMFNNSFEILKKYINLQPTQRLFDVSINVIDKNFQAIKKKLNLNITIHSLRHNFITRLVELNVPEHIIQYLVGHSKDSKITKKVYTHVRTEALNQAINLINKNI